MPICMRDVFDASSVISGYGSCQRIGESYVQPLSKPSDSALTISSTRRWKGGSGRTVTPKRSISARYIRGRPGGGGPWATGSVALEVALEPVASDVAAEFGAVHVGLPEVDPGVDPGVDHLVDRLREAAV